MLGPEACCCDSHAGSPFQDISDSKCLFPLTWFPPLTDCEAHCLWAPKMLHQHHSNGVIHAPTAMCIEFYSRSYLGRGGRKGSHPYTPCCFSESAYDSKSPTYERSGCELSKMRTCIRTSSHRSPCVWHALSQACNTYKCLCFCVLYDIVSSTVLQYYCSIITVVLLQ